MQIQPVERDGQLRSLVIIQSCTFEAVSAPSSFAGCFVSIMSAGRAECGASRKNADNESDRAKNLPTLNEAKRFAVCCENTQLLQEPWRL